MTKTAIAIRHLMFEDLGAFEPVLAAKGYALRYHDIGVHDLAQLRAQDPDLLFVLGGPIGAYEENLYPFLLEELALIEHRLQAKRPIFGICLGAQLMARALGSRVYPGPTKEIGFAPITLSAEGATSCLKHFKDANVLHWHGDTFDLPSGAVRLASTPICQNQAFAYGDHALAVQFHPEAGNIGFERWLIGHTMELSKADIDINQLREEGKQRLSQLGVQAAACLTEWLG